MSPALKQTDEMLSQLMGITKPTQPRLQILNLKERRQLPKLSASQKRLITKARRAKPIVLSDRELARLVSVALHDLGRIELVPQFIGKMPDRYKSYYDLPLSWFQSDAQRPFDFATLFLSCHTEIDDFETIFQCLCEIHKRRRAYDLILRGQPKPSMDQIARKGLLEYGVVHSPALTSWLVWRKWIYDIDNRSAQQTGYLFEPILAQALGGVSCGAANSPIKRSNRKGSRQVDCLIDADDEKRAYEFKVRFTIASSGQGRFEEEKSFPSEAMAAGFIPVLVVLDPTPNEKMDVLVDLFRSSGGEAYVGEDAWRHIAERAGRTMTSFLSRYIRAPIEAIVNDEANAPAPLTLCWDIDSSEILVTVGDQTWAIDRRNESEIGEDIDDAGDDPEDEGNL
jgi:hypothetical protein